MPTSRRTRPASPDPARRPSAAPASALPDNDCAAAPPAAAVSAAAPALDAGTSRLRTPRDITDLLNFRLAALVGASGAAVIRLCEGQYGVSRREWALLGLLAVRGAQAPSEIADQCHLDRTRVSRAITRLTAKGLIRRQTLDGDRRRASVALTPAGQALYRQLFDEVAAINRQLVETLSDGELAALDTLLTALTEQAVRVKRQVATTVSTNRWRGGSARRQWSAPEEASDDALDEASENGPQTQAISGQDRADR